MKRPYKKLYTELYEEVRLAKKAWIGDDHSHLPLTEAMERVRLSQFTQLKQCLFEDFYLYLKGKPRTRQNMRLALKAALDLH